MIVGQLGVRAGDDDEAAGYHITSDMHGVHKDSLTVADADNSPLISKRNESQLRSHQDSENISLKHKANTAGF